MDLHSFVFKVLKAIEFISINHAKPFQYQSTPTTLHIIIVRNCTFFIFYAMKAFVHLYTCSHVHGEKVSIY